jgi:transcriptional regulator with XRE-family HTH domain
MQKASIPEGSNKRRKEPDLLARLGFNIRKYRIMSGLTQEQLEEKTRVTISRCEAGKYNMTVSTLSIISKALKVEAYELLK